jgi:hypothetical protein
LDRSLGAPQNWSERFEEEIHLPLTWTPNLRPYWPKFTEGGSLECHVCVPADTPEFPAEGKCLWKLVQQHLLLWTNFLTGEAKWVYITEPADRWKPHVNPSTDHSKHFTCRDTPGFCNADSAVILGSYISINYKHSTFFSESLGYWTLSIVRNSK